MRRCWVVMAWVLAGALVACPRWLTLANCHSDADCETQKCGPDGVCLVPLPAQAGPCPECQTLQGGPFQVDGGQRFLAAHAPTVPGTPILLADESGATYRMTSDGHLTQLNRVPGGILTPAAVVAAGGSRPALVALRAWDGALRMFSFPADALEDMLGTGDAGPSHQPVVVLSSAETALLAAPDDNGQLYVVAVTNAPSDAFSFSLPLAVGQPGPAFAAACRTPDLIAVDGVGGVVMARVSAGADGGRAPRLTRLLDAPADGGVLYPPVFPPVMVVETPTRVAVYSFRNTPDAVVTRETVVLLDGGVGLLDTRSLPLGEPMSGTAAVTLVEGEPWVAVPLHSGTLRLVRREADGVLTSERWQVPPRDGGVALGGVSSVRLRPEDPSATLVFGDANGDVHAVRDRVALPLSAGWPFRVAGPVTQAPVLLFFPGRSRLSLVVTAGTPGAPLVDIRSLGATYWRGALVWPESQHDAENSGCLEMTP